MLRTKDVLVGKPALHLLALECILSHDVGAGEVLALILDKLRSKGADKMIQDNVQEQSSCYEVALNTLPQAISTVQEAIKVSLLEYAAKMQPPPPQKLEEIEFDLVSFVQRCEAFTSRSPLLRDQLGELSRCCLPMSRAACPDCTLPPTAAELEAAALAALLESTKPSSPPKIKKVAPSKKEKAKVKSTKK
jgi:hypothetical protein